MAVLQRGGLLSTRRPATPVARVPRRHPAISISATMEMVAPRQHPDAVRRRAEAEKLQADRSAERQEERRQTQGGLKWWQAPSAVRELQTQEEFQAALEASTERLVVVKYFAEDCYSCRSFMPKLNKLAAEHSGVEFVKLNGSQPEFQALLQQQGVSSAPWFHFFRGGELVASMTASINPDKLRNFRRALARYGGQPSV